MRRPKGQQKNPARGFGVVGLQPFLVFCVFCLFTITLFSPENGFFCSFLSVSLSFSLASFSFPFSLSLSLSLVSCFLFPCFLVYYSSFLVFFVVISCLVSLRLFHGKSIWKASFHQSFSVFWVFLFCFVFQILFFFLFLFLSFFQLCFGQHKCFQFSKKTISKTLSFVSRIVQSYRFFKGPIWGQIWVMFEKHCKNRHFSTGLRALWSKQIRFSGVEGLGLRLLCGPGDSVRVQAPKQNIKNKNFRHWGFQWFVHVFGHWYRTTEVINVKRWITPPPKKKT